MRKFHKGNTIKLLVLLVIATIISSCTKTNLYIYSPEYNNVRVKTAIRQIKSNFKTHNINVLITTEIENANVILFTVDNQELIAVNEAIRNHPIEAVGKRLRTAMTAMKVIKTDVASENSVLV